MTSAITGTAGKTRRRDRLLSRFADNDRWLWRAMLAPAILYIGLLVGFPFLLSLYYSVSSVTVASQDVHFVGLEDFRRIVERHVLAFAAEYDCHHGRFPVLRPRVCQHSGDGTCR